MQNLHILLNNAQDIFTTIPLLTGIIASVVHVLSGPDHLAAVTPLAIESKKKSWGVGFSWGIGHTLGMLIIGVLFIVFKDYIPVDIISTYGEQIVGYLLIIIGVIAIVRIFLKSNHTHSHPHQHGGDTHIHTHNHSDENKHTHTHKKTNKQNVLTALFIGIIHGVAGVSHIIAILPTLALPSKIDSVLYLSGFGAGTILAMVLYAFILGFIADKSSDKSNSNKVFNSLRFIGGLMAIVVGIYWIAITI